MGKAFAIGTVIKKTAEAIVGCVKKADELKQSYNTLQTQTGATNEEMAGLEQSLKNIYANNYGESFEDIANAMAEVKNQTSLTGEELEKTTQNAIALRDTFDYDIQESTRAADMMMKQFGLTSDEAFNLIAQGSQNGLDKNGNLLDSINEYSVHFKQLGFNAEDMFNMLSNGAESGVFDIDKLGDAVKEFGIRAKDGSDTTVTAFEMLGLNSDELQKKFADGGEGAKEAFKEVAGALQNCDDEVVKNTAGVNLFGTMWEDMGAEAVAALTNTNGNISATKDTLSSINEIKYDDLGSAFEGIKRQIDTGLIIPIGETLLPLVNEFANWVNEHMPEIQQVFEVTISVIEEVINKLAPIFEVALTLVEDVFDIFSAAFNGDWDVFWEKIGKFFSDIVSGLNTILNTELNILIDVLSSMTEGMKNAAVALFKKISEGFSEIWQGIETWFGRKLNELKNSLTKKKDEFKKAGKAVFNAVWDGIKSIWSSIEKWVTDKVDWLKDKLSFWRSGKDEMNEGGSDGSHRTGLYRVPYDDYRAILHKGEMVLTQPEADQYRNENNISNEKTNIVQNFYGVKEEKTAFETYRKTKKVLRDLGIA